MILPFRLRTNDIPNPTLQNTVNSETKKSILTLHKKSNSMLNAP